MADYISKNLDEYALSNGRSAWIERKDSDDKDDEETEDEDEDESPA